MKRKILFLTELLICVSIYSSIAFAINTNKGKQIDYIEEINRLSSLFANETSNEKKAEYLYKIAETKMEMANNCISERVADRVKKRGSEYEKKWKKYIEYIKANESNFFEFEPAASYYYKNKEYTEIIERYPDTDYADRCRFEKVLEKTFGEWEGFTDSPITELQNIYDLIKKHPKIEFKDYTIKRFAYDYVYILDSPEATKQEKEKFLLEAKYFYQKHKNIIDKLYNENRKHYLLANFMDRIKD
jgi:hypothetical protein